MTDQHTPGPWHVVTDKTTRYTWLVGVADTWIPRIACIPPYAHSPVAANARLIAAAPEMWDLIVELFEDPKLSLIIGGNPNQVSALMERADKLRAKARGTQ